MRNPTEHASRAICNLTGPSGPGATQRRTRINSPIASSNGPLTTLTCIGSDFTVPDLELTLFDYTDEQCRELQRFFIAQFNRVVVLVCGFDVNSALHRPQDDVAA